MKKQTTYVLATIGTLLVLWSSQAYADRIKETALKNGINYLLITDDQYIAGASLLAERLSVECDHNELEEHLEGKYNDDLKHSSFLQKRHATPESDDPVLSDKEINELNQGPSTTDAIVIKSAYCSNFSYENIMSSINQIRRDKSYYSTHILHALTKSREKGCYKENSEEISLLINDLVDELMEAQAKSEQNGFVCNKENIDIYAERALFISDAGFPLKDEWLENILNCQQSNGGWFAPHPTSLSLLTIAKTLDSCQ